MWSWWTARKSGIRRAPTTSTTAKARSESGITVGKNAADAQSARLAKQAELTALENGLEIPNAPEMIGGQDKHSLAAAIASYLEDVKLSKKPKTYSAYATTLTYFAESCRKQFVEDIDRKDMLRFPAFLRDEKDQSPRSCLQQIRKHDGVLKTTGRARAGRQELTGPGSPKNHRKFTSEKKSRNFWNACEPNERLWFEFFLMTGMREQEVMYMYWSDINFAKCTVKVTHKPDLDWTPKAYKEREIPVPESLIASLKRLEDRTRQLHSGLRDIRLQTEEGFSRLLQSYREAGEAQS